MSVSLDKNNGAATKFRTAAVLRNASTDDLIERLAQRGTDPLDAYDFDAELNARFAHAPHYNDRLRKADNRTYLDLCRAAFPAPVAPFNF